MNFFQQLKIIKYNYEPNTNCIDNFQLQVEKFLSNLPEEERNDKEKGFFAEAFFPFDRTVFGINYGIGAVDTEVQLAIHLYGNKQF